MSAQLAAVDLLVQSSTPLFKLGTLYHDEYGRQFTYGIANSTVTAGYWCDMTTDGTYDFTHTTTTRCGTPGTHWKLLGVACMDFTNNYYGWYWTGYGTFEAVIENNFAAGDVLYTTGNAGLPGTDSSSFQIDGVKTIDAGVTATRVTVWAAGRLTAGVAEAAD
jgi:hypothetical protein